MGRGHGHGYEPALNAPLKVFTGDKNERSSHRKRQYG